MSRSTHLAGDGGEHPPDVLGVSYKAASVGEPDEQGMEHLLALVERL